MSGSVMSSVSKVELAADSVDVTEGKSQVSEGGRERDR